MPGASEFLRDCSDDFERGLAQWDKLTGDDQRRLLASAADLLKTISAEWDKCEAILGSHLRLAMVERLQADIRKAIRDLEKRPISA